MLCDYFFMCAHGKLDLTFVKAMTKLSCSAVRERKAPSLTEMCTHLSRNRREKYYPRVLDKNVA